MSQRGIVIAAVIIWTGQMSRRVQAVRAEMAAVAADRVNLQAEAKRLEARVRSAKAQLARQESERKAANVTPAVNGDGAATPATQATMAKPATPPRRGSPYTILA